MEQHFRAVALIQSVKDNRLSYLLHNRQNPNNCRDPWTFVIGQRLETESFRETVIREVAWQLNLDRKTDFLVSHMAQRCVETIEPLPGKCYPVHLAVAFFPVHFYRSHVIARFENEPNWRWFSSREVIAGRTDQGAPIDPTVVQWLKSWEVIHPWE